MLDPSPQQVIHQPIRERDEQERGSMVEHNDQAVIERDAEDRKIPTGAHENDVASRSTNQIDSLEQALHLCVLSHRIENDCLTSRGVVV
jgi:hypothetical protein